MRTAKTNVGALLDRVGPAVTTANRIAAKDESDPKERVAERFTNWS